MPALRPSPPEVESDRPAVTLCRSRPTASQACLQESWPHRARRGPREDRVSRAVPRPPPAGQESWRDQPVRAASRPAHPAPSASVRRRATGTGTRDRIDRGLSHRDVRGWHIARRLGRYPPSGRRAWLGPWRSNESPAGSAQGPEARGDARQWQRRRRPAREATRGPADARLSTRHSQRPRLPEMPRPGYARRDSPAAFGAELRHGARPADARTPRRERSRWNSPGCQRLSSQVLK